MQKIKITNSADIIRAQDGHLAPEQIRTTEVDALIDTGASTLILPADVVARLGFTQVEVKKVRLADGSLIDSPRVTNIRLEICGRDMLTSAYVMPAGTTPLVGRIPLEELDLVVDARRQELRPNPEHPDGPVIDALAAA
ncbi:MAG TPA: aspartyl protease family protein [Polyangia bacterium]|nr:aspartyl protease family protein [Polyangia bacterium]